MIYHQISAERFTTHRLDSHYKLHFIEVLCVTYLDFWFECVLTLTQLWRELRRQQHQRLHHLWKPEQSPGRSCLQCQRRRRTRDSAHQSLSTKPGQRPGGVSQNDAPYPPELRPVCVPGTAGPQEELQVSCFGPGQLGAVRGRVQQEQHRTEQQLLRRQGASAAAWHLHGEACQGGVCASRGFSQKAKEFTNTLQWILLWIVEVQTNMACGFTVSAGAVPPDALHPDAAVRALAEGLDL